MRKTLFATAVLMSLLGAPAHAQPKLMIEQPDWNFYVNNSTQDCFVIQLYNDGEMFISAGHNPQKDTSTLVFANQLEFPAWHRV